MKTLLILSLIIAGQSAFAKGTTNTKQPKKFSVLSEPVGVLPCGAITNAGECHTFDNCKISYGHRKNGTEETIQ